MLIRDVRLPARSRADLRLRAGRILEIGRGLERGPGEEVHEAAGAIAIPGLWDQHVHASQTVQGASRLDTSGAATADDLLDVVRAALRDRTAHAGALVGEALVGFGHRLVDLDGELRVAELDAVAGTVPVVLIGGDAHHAWMSTSALDALGLPRRQGVVGEDEWFGAVARLEELPGVAAGLLGGVERMQRDALARGVVGIVDMEWGGAWELWQRTPAHLRVCTAVYPADLDRAPGPSGTAITSEGLVRMGPLKVILDGALGSHSALCRRAYGAPEGQGHGTLSVPTQELIGLLHTAQERGLQVAVHAIGDAAVGIALDCFAATGTRGRIEHAQMLTDDDVARMAALGMTASVQPAHLLDDRDPTEDLWGATASQAFRFLDLLRAGVPLVLGSDAPVAPLDPWLAMAAAVHRSADARPGWFPDQQLQPREALAASTDGVEELAVGGRADVVLLEEDPFEGVPLGGDGVMVESAAREAGERLRSVRPLATVVAGHLAFRR